MDGDDMKNLKPKDIEDIEKFHSHSPQAKMMKEYLNWKFEVGDVLIRSSTNQVEAAVIDKALYLRNSGCYILISLGFPG
jgi:hypothetical protein